MPSSKERRQMWIYIIILTLIIGGLWLVFFKKEISAILDKNEQKQEKSLGEIFSSFGQSVSHGVKVFSEMKNQLPNMATTTPTSTDNLVK